MVEPCASSPSTPRSRPAPPPCSTPTRRHHRAARACAMVRGHAEALMPLIARVMDLAAIEFADLDRIAVTTGPGSFTGLRVGIAAARGIALAAGKPAVGLSTLAAFAAPHIAEDDTHARRGGDRRAPRPRLSAGVRHRRAHAGRAAHRDACATRCERRSPGPARIVGSAAKQVAAAWPSGANRRCWSSSAARRTSTGSRGSAPPRRKAMAPPKPLYLRAPDAQPQDAARLPRR